VALNIIGGSTSKLFFQTVCGQACTVQTLTPVEWYLVFASAAVLLSQLPNLNSIAGVSLIGSITAVVYCTIMWMVSVNKDRLSGITYKPVRGPKEVDRLFEVLNSLGIIAFAFRGHNLVLEIQVP
jgi:amino acid permease